MIEEYESAKVCKLFPYEIRMALVRASRVPIPHDDPLARLRAIERATEKARDRAPGHFA